MPKLFVQTPKNGQHLRPLTPENMRESGLEPCTPLDPNPETAYSAGYLSGAVHHAAAGVQSQSQGKSMWPRRPKRQRDHIGRKKLIEQLQDVIQGNFTFRKHFCATF